MIYKRCSDCNEMNCRLNPCNNPRYQPGHETIGCDLKGGCPKEKENDVSRTKQRREDDVRDAMGFFN